MLDLIELLLLVLLVLLVLLGILSIVIIIVISIILLVLILMQVLLQQLLLLVLLLLLLLWLLLFRWGNSSTAVRLVAIATRNPLRQLCARYLSGWTLHAVDRVRICSFTEEFKHSIQIGFGGIISLQCHDLS